jgi:hypothetical protein
MLDQFQTSCRVGQLFYMKLSGIQIEKLRRWRGALSRIAAIVIVVIMVYWGWQNYSLVIQVFASLGAARFLFALLLINLAFLLTVTAFVLLVRSLGYGFKFADGFHSLNLAQVAAMLPGSVWGLIGLAGLLWGKGVSKRDSALIIFLNTAFGLAAGALFGAVAFIATFGLQYAVLGVIPVGAWLGSRDVLESLRQRFFAGSSPLPSGQSGLKILGACFLAWSVESACFTWLVFNGDPVPPTSPLFVASAYAAGYFVGFIALFAPAGLGVREGVIALILGSSIDVAQVFAVALTFRIIQTIVMWLNISIALLIQTRIRTTRAE